ncbi:MAG: TonB-dependent receptor [Saprospiraceae bacterium]|nr:TonB-dependent receptor [Saprospiraceae bacterium]
MNVQKRVLALFASLILLCPFQIFAQTQTLKGQVLDKGVRHELIGATVQIAAADSIHSRLAGAMTDAAGRFRFNHLPVGKYTILVTYIGYRNAVLHNITLDAGKETELIIEMEETVLEQEEVVITATLDKEKPLNEFSLVSARTFSVEETRRFAAAVNDPARMATSFAGVISANDGNNIIVIRGNSPNGMLWRMEGVDIPNPNHFSSVGNSGGGISILSSQLLSNSDFSTGAFAAEYGNALSGVFDLRLRKGNSDRREFTVQAGVLGLDLAAEGPLSQGKNAGSYLVNYRYSTLSLLAQMGVPLGDAITNFQDLSFNVWQSAGKFGSFSLFGLGGLSKQSLQGKPDTAAWNEDSQNRYPYVFKANTGVVGLTHSKIWGANTHLRTALVVSGTENGLDAEEYLLPDYRLRLNFNTNNRQTKGTISTVLSHKFNARHYLRSGVYVNLLGYKLQQYQYDVESERLQEQLKQHGNTQTVQAFSQWQYRPTDRLTFNFGVHALAMLLNQKVSIEPRAAIKYAHNRQHAFSLGYGVHAQVAPIGTYFVKNEQGELLNPDLDMSKAQHFVLGYDYFPLKKLHFKGEVYYQHLYDVPVDRNESGSYSLLNQFDGIVWRSLENTGLGRNYGLELTGEQFLHKGLYWMSTLSLFRSEYRGSDLVWRNTRYDSRYAATITAGKEWGWNRRNKNRSFGLNFKLITTGGHRDTPIDLAASEAKGETVYKEDQAFELIMPAYFRADIGVRIKRNYRHLTTTLSLDIQNVSNRQNIGGKFYNAQTKQVATWYQAPLIPVLAYRLDF